MYIYANRESVSFSPSLYTMRFMAAIPAVRVYTLIWLRRRFKITEKKVLAVNFPAAELKNILL